MFHSSLCWAETTTSSSEEVKAKPFQGADSPTVGETSHKENRLTAITVENISDEQVTIKLSTLFLPRYGTILIPPDKTRLTKNKKKGHESAVWYFAINITETRNFIKRNGSSHTFKKQLAHSLLKRIRATQFKYNPPIARVVFDLTTPQTPKITATEDGLTVVFQKPKREKIPPAPLFQRGGTGKVNNLTAVNVDVKNEQISIAFAFGHKPTYKSGLLIDKENHRFYFYLNLRNTRSFVAGGKVFKQEIEDALLTRVMVSQYKREPPMARIVFYLNKYIKPQIVSEEDKLFVKFPRYYPPPVDFAAHAVGGNLPDKTRRLSAYGEKSADRKRAAGKLTEIKIDDKAKDSITIQLILDGIPDYRTVLTPANQASRASFCINFLNTTIQGKEPFEKDIYEEPLKKVRAIQYKNNPPVVRVIFDISDAIKPDIEERENQLIVKYPKHSEGGKLGAKLKDKAASQGEKTRLTKKRQPTRKRKAEGSERSGEAKGKPTGRGARLFRVSGSGRISRKITAKARTKGHESTQETQKNEQEHSEVSASGQIKHGGQENRPPTSSSTNAGNGLNGLEHDVAKHKPAPLNRAQRTTEKSVDNPQPKQPSIIKDITALVLPKETILNIDIEGEIGLRQATYVTNSVGADPSALPRGGSEREESTFSLKLAATAAKMLRQININKGIIHSVILNPLEGEEKRVEILVRLSEKVPYSVDSADAPATPSRRRGSDAVYAGTQPPRKLHRLAVKFENPPLEQLVSLNINEESLRTVMLMLSQQYGANIVAGSDLSGKVSIHATNVPLKEALRQILQAEGYTYVQEPGGFLRVLKEEDTMEETGPKVDLSRGEAVVRKVIELKYALATELVESLQKIIGEKGSVVAEKRTNSLIVTDTEENLADLQRIIAQLDKESSYVSADGNPNKDGNSEAKDKEAKLRRRVWRLSYISPDEASAYIQPLLKDSGSITIIEGGHTGAGKGASSNRTPTQGSPYSSSADGFGSAVSLQGGGAGGTQRLSVGLGGTIMVTDTEEHLKEIQEIIEQIDVPIPQVEIQAYIVEGTITNQDNLGIDWRMAANKGASEINASLPFGGDFPALRLKVGNLSTDDFIGILKILSARTDTKVLSSPKIMTIGNRQATFTSGDQIPYTELSITQNADTIATTSFKDTGIILHVIANVKRANMVSLTIDTEVSDVASFTPTGQPRISQRKATTQVLVKDGDTAVIGGLIMERSDETVSKVPILGDIPLLGRLFRTTNKKNVKSEITVFITPRIVKQ